MTATAYDAYSGGYHPPERYEREPSSIAPYRFILADTLTGVPIAEVPFTGVSYGRTVSTAGEFSGTIQLAGQDVVPGLDLYNATMPVRTSLFIMRDLKVMWGGLIWGRGYGLASRQLSVSGATFESYLFNRKIWHSLTTGAGADQYDVVRDLIDAMQTDMVFLGTTDDGTEPVPLAASIGLEVSDEMSGHNKDAGTWDGGSLTSFGDAISEMSNNQWGFEWNIDCWWDEELQRFRKKLNFRLAPPSLRPPGDTTPVSRTGLNENFFQYPGSIADLSLDESGDASATRFWVVGGAPEGVSTDYRPKAAWTNDDYITEGWPLLEQVESSRHDDTTNPVTLGKYARTYGQRARPVVPSWSVTVNALMDPQLGTWELGDWCRLLVEDEFIKARLDQTVGDNDEIVKRIMGYQVDVPDNPQQPELVTLTLVDEWVAAS